MVKIQTIVNPINPIIGNKVLKILLQVTQIPNQDKLKKRLKIPKLKSKN